MSNVQSLYRLVSQKNTIQLQQDRDSLNDAAVALEAVCAVVTCHVVHLQASHAHGQNAARQVYSRKPLPKKSTHYCTTSGWKNNGYTDSAGNK